MNSFVSYIHAVFMNMAEHKGALRIGQAYYNVLYELRPDLATDIKSTDLDPFYDDKRIPAMLTWLSSVMDDPKCQPSES